MSTEPKPKDDLNLTHDAEQEDAKSDNLLNQAHSHNDSHHLTD